MSPEDLDQLVIVLTAPVERLLGLAIILMMFAIALSIKKSDFHSVATKPKLFAAGLLSQLIALPAATVVLIQFIQPAPSVALGMIVVAACPGGNVSNFLSWIARANVAYSVALTATSSLVAAMATPAAILFWSNLYSPTAMLLTELEFNQLAFIAQTTTMLALPLGLGMTVRQVRPNFAEKIRKPIAAIGATLIIFVIVYSAFDIVPLLLPVWPLILGPVIIHNLMAFALGAIAGAIANGSPAERRTLIFEVGIQNAGLAVVLLLAPLQGLGGAASVAAVWGVWHFISGGAIVLFFRVSDAYGFAR